MKKSVTTKRNPKQKEDATSIIAGLAFTISHREWMAIAAYCIGTLRSHAAGPFGCYSLLIETNANYSEACERSIIRACGPRGLGLRMSSADEIDVTEDAFDRCRKYLREEGFVTHGIAKVLRGMKPGDQLAA